MGGFLTSSSGRLGNTRSQSSLGTESELLYQVGPLRAMAEVDTEVGRMEVNWECSYAIEIKSLTVGEESMEE